MRLLGFLTGEIQIMCDVNIVMFLAQRFLFVCHLTHLNVNIDLFFTFHLYKNSRLFSIITIFKARFPSCS